MLFGGHERFSCLLNLDGFLAINCLLNIDDFLDGVIQHLLSRGFLDL